MNVTAELNSQLQGLHQQLAAAERNLLDAQAHVEQLRGAIQFCEGLIQVAAKKLADEETTKHASAAGPSPEPPAESGNLQTKPVRPRVPRRPAASEPTPSVQ